MKTRFLIIPLIILFIFSITEFSIAKNKKRKKKSNNFTNIYISESSPLVMGEMIFTPENKDLTDDVGLSIEQKDKYDKIHPMYLTSEIAGNRSKIYFKLEKSYFSDKTESVRLKNLKFTPLNKIRTYEYYDSIDTYSIIRDEEKFTSVENRWRSAFRKKLENIIDKYEDNEFETLQYLRWFGNIYSPSRYSWKKNELFRFLTTISGLRDIKDAIPFDKNKNLKIEEETENIPDPIILPMVTTPATELDKNISRLSRYIPRSCYYVEWNSYEDFIYTLESLTSEFNRWSKDIYPRKEKELIDYHLNRIGLTENYINKHLKNNVESLILAGWDFNFQSGTNLLLVIKTRNEIIKPENTPYSKLIDNNTIILSTGKKLMNMALKADSKKKSIFNLNNFRYSRNKMKKDKNEKLFLYLSDFWLTNFISPRWIIQNNRLNSLNTRIKMIQLLKIIIQKERNMKNLPDLESVRKYSILKPELKKWIFRDITEEDGILSHNILRGLNDHPPVDTLPFKKITPSELKNYEDFKQRYSRRWREIDPLAFQIIQGNKPGKWITKLYLSPISNRSSFRWLRNYVPEDKLTHNMENCEDLVIGLSLAIRTKLLRGFIPVNLPINVFIKLMTFDFAPTSFKPAYWLLKPWRQETLSYLRMPAILSIPQLIFQSGIIPGGVLREKSEFQDIDRLSNNFVRFPYYFAYLFSPENSGFDYISLNPDSLKRFKKDLKKELVTDKIPCDLRYFINLKNGYMLRRKIWQEAIKNRGVESFRRFNRVNRISDLLGLKNDYTTKSQLEKNIRTLNIFPVELLVDSSIASSITYKTTPSYTWSTDVNREFGNLPLLLQYFEKTDGYISIENNGIFMENHIKLYTQEKTDNVTGINIIQPEEKTENVQLDFDEE